MTSPMAASGIVHALWHGTTRRRAESIVRSGLSLNYKEPGGQPDPADIAGFSTARPGKPCPTGDPEIAAWGKARIFPNEGGPVILEMAVPDEIVLLAIRDLGGEVRFQLDFGFQELLDRWPTITKRILPR